jgi:predicted homoserine dehydrogenase-like protein
MYLSRDTDERITDDMRADWLAEHGVDPDRYRTRLDDIEAGDKVLVISGRGRNRRVLPVTKTTKTQVTVDIRRRDTDPPDLVRFSRASEWKSEMPQIGSGSSYDTPSAHWIDARVVDHEISTMLDRAEDAARVEARNVVDRAASSLTSAIRMMRDQATIESFSERIREIQRDAEQVIRDQDEADRVAREERLARRS